MKLKILYLFGMFFIYLMSLSEALIIKINTVNLEEFIQTLDENKRDAFYEKYSIQEIFIKFINTNNDFFEQKLNLDLENFENLDKYFWKKLLIKTFNKDRYLGADHHAETLVIFPQVFGLLEGVKEIQISINRAPYAIVDLPNYFLEEKVYLIMDVLSAMGIQDFFS